jgi:hypothetical protein
MSNLGSLTRVLSGIGLSVFFGFLGFFIVQSTYTITGGSLGYWPKNVVIFSWFYFPGLFASLGTFLTMWIYSEYRNLYRFIAISIVLITSIASCYFAFNSTIEEYEGLDYWLKFGMMKDVANTTVWTSIVYSNIVSISMVIIIFLYDNYFLFLYIFLY